MHLSMVLQRLWSPSWGARERTAATALLLLLVVGTAQGHDTTGWRPNGTAAETRPAELMTCRVLRASKDPCLLYTSPSPRDPE